MKQSIGLSAPSLTVLFLETVLLLFCLVCSCQNEPERMIARPNTLVILRKWVGQIYQTHNAAKEGGGRSLKYCV